jgi:hypothetical protein
MATTYGQGEFSSEKRVSLPSCRALRRKAQSWCRNRGLATSSGGQPMAMAMARSLPCNAGGRAAGDG